MKNRHRQTREEYLASVRVGEPWVAAGVAKSTWYQLKAKGRTPDPSWRPQTGVCAPQTGAPQTGVCEPQTIVCAPSSLENSHTSLGLEIISGNGLSKTSK
jgi:hypothetical protein